MNGIPGQKYYLASYEVTKAPTSVESGFALVIAPNQNEAADKLRNQLREEYSPEATILVSIARTVGYQ